MKWLVLLMVACGGSPTPAPKLPDKPDQPVLRLAPIVEWTQLHGTVDKVAVGGLEPMLTNEITQLFADQQGKAIDRDAIRERLAQVLRLPGVWSATVKGVQLQSGIRLQIIVEPAPVLRKLTLVEWGKERPLDGSGMAKPSLGLPIDPARIEQLADSQRARMSIVKDVTVSWETRVVANGVEVVIDIAHDPALVKSP